MTLGEIIRVLRDEKGLSGTKAAKLLNISVGYLHDIESGRTTPSLAVLSSIADCFEVSLDYLTGRSEKTANSDETTAVNIEDLRMTERTVVVPVMTREALASCSGTIDYSGCQDEPEEMRYYSMRELGGCIDDLRKPFGVYAAGECLRSARIEDGDTLIINPAVDWRPWDICLVQWMGGWSAKKIVPQPDGSIDLHSDQGVLHVPVGDIDSGFFQVIGKVVRFDAKPIHGMG